MVYNAVFLIVGLRSMGTKAVLICYSQEFHESNPLLMFIC